MTQITNIIILAAGDGDRFWPLKDKPITSFLGKPLLQHTIEGLTQYGKKMVVVCSEKNYKRIKAVLPDGVSIIMQDERIEGMAGAILSCKGKLKGDALIIGNDFFDFSATQELVEKMQDTAELVFLAKRVDTYFPGGYLKLEENKLRGIIEKPVPDKTPSDLVKLVADYHKDIDVLISYIEGVTTQKDDRYEQALDLFMKEGKADFVSYDGYWQALKYPWHILEMTKVFLTKVDSYTDQSGIISGTAVINGKVHIGRNVRIGDFVKISGPCFIGDNTVIGDYSLIRESHIDRNCLIGSSSEVARSYIGEHTSLHRNYVGDSVLAGNVLFGAGAVTANFRFDELNVLSQVKGYRVDSGLNKLGTVVGEGTKIGVNSTLFPGVKIGAGSLIGPAEKISHDVKDNMYVSNGEEKTKK